VWHSCGATNTAKLEKLQFRALKFVYLDYTSSYESLLARANLPDFELSRLEVFKAYNKLSPPYMTDLFDSNVPIHSYNLRHNNMIHTHRRTTKYGLHSFNHVGITIWNKLPNHMRASTDYKVFKSMIKTWSGKCSCAFCDS
jgi:hypothetical protein